ncbi:MAG: hypothetical protein MI742_05735 [Desulfobacterales bacterium]|nr:hypothetical protein [Desulfobacterales bacterium]
MTLEFRQGLVPQNLAEELETQRFLALFDLGIPLIPTAILEAMDQNQGRAHFEALRKVEKAFSFEEISALIESSRTLPPLDGLLPHFESAALQQYHLFELYQFLSISLKMQEMEASFAISKTQQECLSALFTILKRRTVQGRSLVTDKRVQRAKEELSKAEKELSEAIASHEKRVEETMGLRMLYPFPREMEAEDPRLKTARSCTLLKVVEAGETLRIDHAPDEELLDLELVRKRLTLELEEATSALLSQINQELVAHSDSFSHAYKERKKRCHLYSLVFVKKREGFVFPEFEDFKEENGCSLSVEGGLSFALSRQRGDRAVPLSMDLVQGANVLYGANMSGKTTVLKTLFFLLTAVQTGLPVPAKSLCLTYPGSVKILLKSSGDLSRNLSSFGEELAFFTDEPQRGAFILVDELFLSTDPVNGAELSRIFIEDYAKRELVFLATTHYPKVLHMKSPRLFRMLDVVLPEGNRREIPLSELASLMPYRLEQVSSQKAISTAEKNRTPMELALCFSLPQSIRAEIEHTLDAPLPSTRDSK